MSQILLNLFGDLPEEFVSYCQKTQIEIVKRGDLALDADIHFILVGSSEQADEVTSEFKCVARNIKIICMGPKDTIKDFLVANGRLFINQDFLSSQLGEYILNKFFNQRFNIHLDESFTSSFQNFKKFNLINHLNMGQSLDRITTDAFEAGFDLVSLRTFLDHAIFYLTYLKQTGKAHIPFEFEYAHNNDFFVVNLYAAVESYTAEFLFSSFGSLGDSNPLNSLLGIAAQSTDFLDVTFVEDPGKIVFTAFYGKQAQLKGLAFNNIQTTSQILTQVESKIESFQPQDELENQLIHKQNGMADKDLPGGFFEIPQPPKNSLLSTEPETREELLEHIETAFIEAYPDKDFSQFSPEDIEELVKTFPDQEISDHISDADKQYLLQMMQKKQLVEEAKSQQQQIFEDPENAEQLKQNIAQNIAEGMSDQLDIQKINELLGGDNSASQQKFQMTVDPSTFSTPEFTPENNPLAPDNADPVIAAEQAVRFAEDHFNDPGQAQAFAIQLAEKAAEHFEDPKAAKQFTQILADNLGQQLAPEQKQAFAEVLNAKGQGENGPSIEVYSHAASLPQPSIPSFVEPSVAATSFAEELTKNFSDPAQIQAFALAQMADIKNKFPDDKSANEFVTALTEQLQDQIPNPTQKNIFIDALENQLSENLQSPIQSMTFDTDADPTVLAQEIAAKAKEQCEDPEQAQAFALNLAFEVQGRLAEPEDFAAALTGEFKEAFENEDQGEQFKGVVSQLVAGMGDDKPLLENDPFGSQFVASQETAQRIKAQSETEEGAQLVKGFGQEDPSVISIGGQEAGLEHATKVKGGKQAADNFTQKIKATPKEEKDNFVARFGGSFEDATKKGEFNFKGSRPKDRKKKLNMFVKETIDNDELLAGLDDTIKAFIHREAPDQIGIGLEQYALVKGVDVSAMTDEMMQDFQENELPQIMSNILTDENQIQDFSQTLSQAGQTTPLKVISGGQPSDLSMQLKQKLQSRIQGLAGVEQQDGTFVVSAQAAQDEEFKTIVKQTLAEAVSDNLDMKDLTDKGLAKSQANTAKELAQSMQLDAKEVTQIVKDSSQQAKDEIQRQVVRENASTSEPSPTANTPEQSLASKQTEVVLMQKVKAAEQEKKQLERKLKAMQVQFKALESTNQKLQSVEKQVKVSEQEVDQALQTADTKTVMSQSDQQQIMQDLKNGKELKPADVERLNKALEGEQRVREQAKNIQREVKRMQIESEKKQLVFQTELGKAEKALKAKDSVLAKAKTDMKNTLDKKEREIEHYKNQVHGLNQKLADDQSAQLMTELKAAKQEAANASKLSEVYKNKLEDVAKKNKSMGQVDKTALVEEENRNLKRLKNQLENKLNADTKSLRSLEERFNKSKQGELEAKNHLAQVKVQMKQFQGQLNLLRTQNENLKKEASRKTSSSGAGNKDVAVLKAQNMKLQDNIKRLNIKLDQAAKASLGKDKRADSVAVQKAQRELQVSLKEKDHLKQQNEKLQLMLKQQQAQTQNQNMEISQPDPAKMAAAQTQKEERMAKVAEKEVGALKKQNEVLQAKLDEAAAKLQDALKKPVKSDEPSAKEQRLEQSVKSMNSELVKAKSEAAEMKKKAMTLKTKVTGLENEVKRLKKENEKAKKTGNKAA